MMDIDYKWAKGLLNKKHDCVDLFLQLDKLLDGLISDYAKNHKEPDYPNVMGFIDMLRMLLDVKEDEFRDLYLQIQSEQVPGTEESE